MSDMLKVRDLRVAASVAKTEGNNSEYWKIKGQADKLERELLKSDIQYLMQLYSDYLELGNKTDLVSTGRLLRKKQTRLEKIMSNYWED